MCWFSRKRQYQAPVSEHEREVLVRENAESARYAEGSNESLIPVPGRLQAYFGRGGATRGSFPGLTGIGLRRNTEDRRGWSEQAKDEV